MNRLSIIILLFGLVAQSLISQNVEVRGRAATSYAGKQIRLYTVLDYVTDLQEKETQDTIKADGSFELSLQAEHTQPVFLKIDNITAQLYVRPDFVYGVTFPEIDSTMNRNPDVELPVNIGIMVNDSAELNNLIFDFLEMYNHFFIVDDGRFLSRSEMIRRCDSLQVRSTRKYDKVKNDYFKTYMNYTIASANANLSRGDRFLMEVFIRNKPIQYEHATYMNFFKSYFKGYLAAQASQRKGESLFHIINTKASYDELLNFVKFDKTIQSDSIRELIILEGLWDLSFNPEFDQEAIKTILLQLNRSTKNKMHKQISMNMLTYFNKLAIGSAAPMFTAMARDKQLYNFSSLKKRWVYLNFFSTSNLESLKEMPKIETLKKKFGDKIVFVSVCLDDSASTYQQYLRANPKFNWLILYNYNKNIKVTAKEAYAITGTEGYFLIDQLGNLVGSPALSPSKGIEYKLNVIFKIKRRDTKTGLR